MITLNQRKQEIAMAIMTADLSDGELTKIEKIVKGENTPRKLMTTTEVCEFLAVSRKTIQNYWHKGYLTPIRYSKSKVRYDRDEVINFYNNGRTE